MKKLNLGLLSSSLYVAFQIFANILSTKIAILPLLNLAVDGGTIIYPLTFTLRDFVHKTWGKKNSRQIVIIAGALNLIMVFLFIAVAALPADPTWPFQTAFESILLPVWRITIASIIAQIISELIDTEIFSIIYKKIGDMTAVFFSNFVALIVDSILFSMIAFYGSMPTETVIQIIISNILIKLVISIISVPTIKLIPRKVDINEM
ncbi:MAG: hypothetical protein ACD_51C00224G0005 [uncultured bacterium]|nr:MAG: hypothetical protein ACD_51C00224G0005 [uncultured bacterium]OGJ48646.1 MAG: hypothetical protein A2344_05095 [Candidatus Peregrinibacteria bacterium RIFOXYB12_FULL_41_12]OGJ48737.1 MAG: hypothetical protein A2244_03520 [Candidatus Peregrinibacteria bacterium RIFOXYA2_FULL_41_18]OGJ52811.1 MAG: hypothetical protein A2448_01260 [Candidatus Peregrinibacteria bacterium RIFOXYC2_FULL_41_22]OGJ52961.1 MAG: hypothetical protein A2336_05600 [Candidatus Peregrinibacteria bacterium RIFOXYB2_FULL